MAYTPADADAIRAAIATGALEVDYGGRRTRFRSLQEMRETLAMIDADLAFSNPLGRPRRFFGTTTGKGLA